MCITKLKSLINSFIEVFDYRYKRLFLQPEMAHGYYSLFCLII